MKNITKISFILLFTLCIIPKIVFSSEIRLEAQKVEVHIGEEFLVNILINTNDSLNAVEGKIIFDDNILTAKDIIDGNSVINFWVDNPHAVNNEVLFSGATPVGFTGTSEKLFSILFIAKHEGEVTISINNAAAYLNDGSGNKTELTPMNTNILVDSSVYLQKESFVDNEAPEDFTPIVVKDKNINEGKNTLIFATQDKGVGISNYYVKEGRFSFFREAKSPYLLSDNNLNHDIYIKVKDKNSNERIVVLPAQNPLSIWKQIEPVLITLIIISSSFLMYLLWKKNKKGHLI